MLPFAVCFVHESILTKKTFVSYNGNKERKGKLKSITGQRSSPLCMIWPFKSLNRANKVLGMI